MEAWQAASMVMMVLRWPLLHDDKHCQHIIVFLRVSRCCVGASVSFTARSESSFHSKTQLMQTAERVDMRGNRGGRYIASLDILIGLSKSLPPLPPPSSVFHHSHTNNGLSALIPLWTGRSIGIGFYLSWGGWRRAAIGREGERRRRWMEREQLRLC